MLLLLQRSEIDRRYDLDRCRADLSLNSRDRIKSARGRILVHEQWHQKVNPTLQEVVVGDLDLDPEVIGCRR